MSKRIYLLTVDDPDGEEQLESILADDSDKLWLYLKFMPPDHLSCDGDEHRPFAVTMLRADL